MMINYPEKLIILCNSNTDGNNGYKCFLETIISLFYTLNPQTIAWRHLVEITDTKTINIIFLIINDHG